MILKDPCDICGGEIHVITWVDEKTRKLMVSHGMCYHCLCNVVLPPIPINELQAQDRERK